MPESLFESRDKAVGTARQTDVIRIEDKFWDSDALQEHLIEEEKICLYHQARQ